MIEELSALATGRHVSPFLADMSAHESEIREIVCGSRVLVIGGAGSIGTSTIRQLVTFDPHTLHVVDHNENNLAEFVRDLRSSRVGLSLADFRTLPLEFGSSSMERFLQDQPPYEIVLNFAAIKHVRSEKDAYSVFQMLDTNVVKTARLLRWLVERGGTRVFFSVSTDKAANPVNLMGASKRLMEHVMFSEEFVPDSELHVSSARFANVAFSEGSLLQSFLKRLEKLQPLAVPKDTRRFFVSLEEAGQICLLSALCTPHRYLLVPKLVPHTDLRFLEDIAVAVLKHRGLEARLYEDEIEARTNVAEDFRHGRYPLLLTPLDTSGEKPYEEFVGMGEVSEELGFQHLIGVPYKPAPVKTISQFVKHIEALVTGVEGVAIKEDVIDAISVIIPEFHHIETGKSLDQRM